MVQSILTLGILLASVRSALNQPDSSDTVGLIEGVSRITALLLPLSDHKKKDDGDEDNILKCSDTCLPAWLGDGWCDTACASIACEKDRGDCEGWCAPDCKQEWIGDGYCDIDCFRIECQYDKEDCANNYTKADLNIPLPSHKLFDYSKCPSSCDPKRLHNGLCEADCNLLECNFDGEDCAHQCAPGCANVWLGDDECDPPCNTPRCSFDKGDCKVCKEGCEPGMLGNGICDSACHNADCNGDVGDCHEVCWAAEKVDYLSEPFFYPHCRTEWQGDGFCDCFCMNEMCNFDFGDCKGLDCSIRTVGEIKCEDECDDFPIYKNFKYKSTFASFGYGTAEKVWRT